MTLGVRQVVSGWAFAGLAGCSVAAPSATQPTSGTLAVGLALEPHSCVAGSNTVRAAVYIADGGRIVRYATSADGQLRVELLQKDGSPAAARVRWLDTPNQEEVVTLASVKWNAEVRFESAESGACPVRIEYRPSDAAAAEGIGPGLTTLVLKDPPSSMPEAM